MAVPGVARRRGVAFCARPEFEYENDAPFRPRKSVEDQ
jgi:hypothetical protein